MLLFSVLVYFSAASLICNEIVIVILYEYLGGWYGERRSPTVVR